MFHVIASFRKKGQEQSLLVLLPAVPRKGEVLEVGMPAGPALRGEISRVCWTCPPMGKAQVTVEFGGPDVEA